MRRILIIGLCAIGIYGTISLCAGTQCLGYATNTEVDSQHFSLIPQWTKAEGCYEQVIIDFSRAFCGSGTYAQASDTDTVNGDEDKVDEKSETFPEGGIDRIWSVVQFASLVH